MDERMEGQLAPLLAGTMAPDFSLPHTLQAHLTLHRLREQFALCQDYAGEFGHFGARLLGISIDHCLSHAAFVRDAQVRFPLLADFHPRGAVARAYGIYREEQGVSARALFVLDGQGIIRFSQAYPDLLNPGVDDLLTTLEAITIDDEHPGAGWGA
jgi:alkyl hydroperoxide reductase subunit AhpC